MTRTMWAWVARRIVSVLAEEAVKAIEARRVEAEETRRDAEALLAHAAKLEQQVAELTAKQANDPLAPFTRERSER